MDPIVVDVLKDFVNDLRVEIREGFATLTVRLENKADKADLARIETQLKAKAEASDLRNIQNVVNTIEKERAREETERKVLTTQKNVRRQFAGWAIGVAVGAGWLIPLYGVIFHH